METAPAGPAAAEGPTHALPCSANDRKCPYIKTTLSFNHTLRLSLTTTVPPPPTHRTTVPVPPAGPPARAAADADGPVLPAQRQRQQQQAAEGQGGTAGGAEPMVTPPPLTNEHIITAWADLNDILFVFEVCARVIETPPCVTRLALCLSIVLDPHTHTHTHARMAESSCGCMSTHA